MKAAAFLGALGELGRVAEAARMVGMSRQSAYRLRARLGEGGLFAQVWDRALAQGRAERAARRSRTGGRGRKVTPLPPERDVFGIGR
jgi:DNA-binding IclR family transcriptional regulator